MAKRQELDAQLAEAMEQWGDKWHVFVWPKQLSNPYGEINPCSSVGIMIYHQERFYSIYGNDSTRLRCAGA